MAQRCGLRFGVLVVLGALGLAACPDSGSKDSNGEETDAAVGSVADASAVVTADGGVARDAAIPQDASGALADAAGGDSGVPPVNPDAGTWDQVAGSGECGSATIRRPFPDSWSRTLVFADQVWSTTGSPTPTSQEAEWMATHYVGTQKVLLSVGQMLRSHNCNMILLQYHLCWGYNRSVGNVDTAGRWSNTEPNTDSEHTTIMANHLFRTSTGTPVQETGAYPMYWTDPASEWHQYFADKTLERMFDPAHLRGAQGADYWDGTFGDVCTSPFNEDVDWWSGYGYAGRQRDAYQLYFGPRANTFLAELARRYSQPGTVAKKAYFIANSDTMVTASWNGAFGERESPGEERPYFIDYRHADGVMVENFQAPGGYFGRDDVLLEMRNIVKLVKRGKVAILQTSMRAEEPAYREALVGSYLLLRGHHTYAFFMGDAAPAPEWWPEYDIDLGAPVGTYPEDILDLQVASGLLVRRFERGVVLLNPEDGPASVLLEGSYRRLSCTGGGAVFESNGMTRRADGTCTAGGSATAAWTVPAHEGRILVP